MFPRNESKSSTRNELKMVKSSSGIRLRFATALQSKPKSISNISSVMLIVSIHLLIISQVTITLALAKQEAPSRKSIVFDVKTPKVFYCPQEKPADPDKMIVKAQPLDKLCEFGGKQRPKNLPSDCYNDVDESEFACDEKKRFMIKLDLAGEISSTDGMDDFDYIMSKGLANKKKVALNGKKY